MTNKTLLKKLDALHACGDAVTWIGTRDLAAVWADCERVDWLLWLADKTGIDRKLLTTCAVKFAERVLPIYEKEYPKDSRVRDCIATVKKWIKGKASDQDLDAAWDAAGGAAGDAAAAARAAAWDAARAAARAAAWDAARAAAWDAARAAAWAAARAAARAAAWAAARAADAARAAADAARDAARAAADAAAEEKQQLKIIRKVIPIELIESGLRKIKA